MRVTVIGAGYVGLVTGAGLAALGHRVRVGEADQERVRQLSSGHVPIFEPDLDRLVRDGLGNGLLSFHRSNIEAAEGAEVVFIAVPTPERDDGAADVSIVEWVIGEVGSHLQEGALVVLKSTVPVGSAKRFQDLLDGVGANVVVLSNPEFLREGSAVADFFHPDRIVIGSKDQRAVEQMVQLYTALDAPIVVTDAVSSEMIKYGANAYLATRVTFANAMANLCEAVGADARDVLLGMGYDRRIGFHFLNPGPGFGGSCFPKDLSALLRAAAEVGHELLIVRATEQVNGRQKHLLGKKILAHFDGSLEGVTIAVWGLAFKPQTVDIREAPALALIDDLLAAGATVQAHDPQAMAHVRALYGSRVLLSDGMYGAAEGADALVLVTEWHEYRRPDFHRLKRILRTANLFDGRNMWEPDELRGMGFAYAGIGRR